MTSLDEMRNDQREDHQPDDGVIGDARVAQILSRKENRRDNRSDVTEDQREMDGPAISRDRITA
jgi:hypothetical protein